METPTAQETIAGNVRVLLTRRKATIRTLATDLGWNYTYLRRRLEDRAEMSVNELFHIAAVLGVPVASLFDRAESDR